ncbi:daughter of sevenless isoform X2 [Leptinotarsa decemlineata]|uniref:daughter of sevenless isoform X2 n=1 Tax=Leptinotarsa decemlineata TaxID=7539 RepID=UPI003D3052BC
MSKNSQEIVFEGWLTKSPPTKRIWRARWRRRWFLLTHSGQLPGQYILTYYTDRNYRKLKGVINLDQCEQVDLGLKVDERKLKFDHVFDIKTPSRTYYLAADTENEMRSWVTCICKVCGLKSTNEDDDIPTRIPINCPDVEITEEPSESQRMTLLNGISVPLPASPVSSSPYIPVSECITGKSPILDPKDFKTLLEYNMRNSVLRSEIPNTHTNESYEFPQRNYMNYMNIQDPRFYDCPRKLATPFQKRDAEGEKNHSPLQSPTDSDSVFNDDDWTANSSSDFNTSRNTRPSDSSNDGDIIATKKFVKTSGNESAPPRPPKPVQTVAAPCYLNLNPSKIGIEAEENDQKSNKENQQKVLTDDMYDFPRSHHIENEASLKRKHCYNNAAPVVCPEGTIFRYDISPRAGTSTSVFRYDLEDTQDAPPSPALSHSSSTPAYSNLPSPSYTQLMAPPMVNRELKPKRKLSDSHSITSNPEPPSPRNAPSVDRKLKPPTPLQEAHMRKNFNVEEDQRKIRAAPSPTPPSLGRSHDSLLATPDEQVYHYLTGKMQYLDLDLEGSSLSNSTKTATPKPQEDTVYKKVDFMKTQAFNITRNILEKERQEPVSFTKK